ncbi:MAG: hypothetical protein BA870_00855 [Desulfuromonadales bacterium C00003094]|jgi:uncharacterized protein (DUF4213/DUF364 family)|nr:MAG: hypothetical protein BA870_00855 [Desulfuromonadales bacterium C00003094]
MSLRKALVESVRSRCSESLQVKINTLLKPPALETKVSPFTVAALENGAIGISYNLFHGDDEAMTRYSQWPLEKLCGKTAGELMEWVLSDDLLERTVGLAALNALSQDFIINHPGSYRIDGNNDLFGLMALDKSSQVGLVGYFRPLLTRLQEKAGKVVVLEKSQDLLRGSYPFTMTDDPTALQQCDKVLITATTVTNDSLPSLMPQCANASFVGVMGPTAGFLPNALFELGIHAVGYSQIENPELFLQRFKQGIKWGDATRKVWIMAR